ncbi:hypothetical protein CEXT_85351, partial [Caerostris extrusa]
SATDRGRPLRSLSSQTADAGSAQCHSRPIQGQVTVPAQAAPSRLSEPEQLSSSSCIRVGMSIKNFDKMKILHLHIINV